jgi:fructokinase
MNFNNQHCYCIRNARFQIAYRTADRMIQSHPYSWWLCLGESAIFHTTCFALSQEPAQSAIVNAAKGLIIWAVRLRYQYISDLARWESRLRVISTYCLQCFVVRIKSEDDAERIYGSGLRKNKLSDFRDMETDLICFTGETFGNFLRKKAQKKIRWA